MTDFQDGAMVHDALQTTVHLLWALLLITAVTSIAVFISQKVLPDIRLRLTSATIRSTYMNEVYEEALREKVRRDEAERIRKKDSEN